jgi:hypothetical protein
VSERAIGSREIRLREWTTGTLSEKKRRIICLREPKPPCGEIKAIPSLEISVSTIEKDEEKSEVEYADLK